MAELNFSDLQGKTLKFINCKIVRNKEILDDDIWVRNGKIINPEPIFYSEKVLSDYVIDCHDAYLVPGFIDLQINGGFGYDFSYDYSRIDEALVCVRKSILASGVTSFCPTLVTSPREIYHNVIPHIKRRNGSADGAAILGIHLEGPFINPLKKGAHPEEYIRSFDNGVDSLQDLYGGLDNVSIVTLAPELENSAEVIKHLVAKDIVVSLGHSNGNLLDGEEAVNNGASFITHLFNAMLPFHHRDPGLVGLLTSRVIHHPISFGIIADGTHTHPAALRIAHSTHPEGLVLVTDAMAAMGLGEGEHRIGSQQVSVCGNRAWLTESYDTLAGSIATMDECVGRFARETRSGLVEAVEAAAARPAAALGLTGRKGTLDYGADADFVLLDVIKGEAKEGLKAIAVRHTVIAGEVVYSTPDIPKLVFAPVK